MKTLILLQDYNGFKTGDEVDVKDEDVESLIADGIAKEKVEITKHGEEEEKGEVLDSETIAAQVYEQIKAEFKSEGTKLFATARDHEKEAKGPWNSFGEFAKSVIVGKQDEKLMNYCKSTGMNIAINADGGFMIPPEFSTAILTAMAKAGELAPKCQNFPSNNNLALPFVNITTQATSWTGGVTIYKPAEGIEKTASLPQLGKAELHLHKMTALVYATDELLQDSPIALETFLNTMVSTEMALTKDEDIVNGSGAGECLGIMNAPCLVSVPKETGQPATTIVTENVLKMASRMYAPSYRNSVWLIAQDAVPQIGVLSIAVGTGGAPVFIADIKNPLGSSLLGRPIIWCPHCQTLGTTGDIILADLSQYITITKAGIGMETATSIHVRFIYDESAFRFVVRFDGQPWWASAITPKHGTNTVSPFVALATRA
ncbi:MAG: phage major capsid protein [Planctomycetota bacterium]|jgi:HK97 family phage major capsid protein